VGGSRVLIGWPRLVCNLPGVGGLISDVMCPWIVVALGVSTLSTAQAGEVKFVVGVRSALIAPERSSLRDSRPARCRGSLW